MIPLGTSEKLIQSLHRRLMDARTPPPPWDALDTASLPDAARAALCDEWALRAVAEYRSMVVLTALIARFAEAGLPLAVTSAATRLVQDEARHTELCVRLAERLGGSGAVTLDARDAQPAGDGLPAHLFVARWTVSLLCIGECASVALLRELAATTRDPCVRAVVATLLRDETLHDRFGWALARLVLPRLRADELEWLGHDMTPALAHYELAAAGVPDAPSDADRATLSHAFGVAPRPVRARAFHVQMDRVILPGLASLGLRAHDAWARRHAADASTT